MLLPDHEIRAAVEAGHIGVTPWDPGLVQPASLDICLGDEIRDSMCAYYGRRFLHPGEFLLGQSLEEFRIPADLAVFLGGKSSKGRPGLVIHSTAGFIDPGFEGQITLELSNVSTDPIPLTPGERIGQLFFHRLTSPAERPYGSPGLGSHYQGQRGATPSYLSPSFGRLGERSHQPDLTTPDPARRLTLDESQALTRVRHSGAIDKLGKT